MEDKWHDIPGFEGKYQFNCFTNQFKSLKRDSGYGHKVHKDTIIVLKKSGLGLRNNLNELRWVKVKDLHQLFYPKIVDKTRSYWVMPMTELGHVQMLCAKLGLSLAELKRGVRNKKEDRPKLQAIYYYLLNDLRFSTTKVGKLFDRNHSTVIWNKQNFEEAITVYEDVKLYYEKLKNCC